MRTRVRFPEPPEAGCRGIASNPSALMERREAGTVEAWHTQQQATKTMSQRRWKVKTRGYLQNLPPKTCPAYKMYRDKDEAEIEGTRSPSNPSHGREPTPDTVNDTLLCLKTAWHNCTLRGFIQQLTETNSDTHSQTLGGAWRIFWKGG